MTQSEISNLRSWLNVPCRLVQEVEIETNEKIQEVGFIVSSSEFRMFFVYFFSRHIKIDNDDIAR